MLGILSFVISQFQRNWKSKGQFGNRRSNLRPLSTVAIVEHLESRRMLSLGGLVIGNDNQVTWNSPQGWTGPQLSAPSIAMNADGTKIVMVVADNTVANAASLYNTVRVLEYSNSGTALTQTSNFILASGTNLNEQGPGYVGGEPLVAMNSLGTNYVVTWAGAGGVVKGAEIAFGGGVPLVTSDLVSPTNTSGTLTYTTVGHAHSIAMQGNGKFVMAWDSNMTDSSNPNAPALREAQARVFNLNLSPATPIIQKLNTVSGQESWRPVVAWTDHGNNATWDVIWSGTRPGQFIPPSGFQIQNGVWLQKYTLAGATNSISGEVLVTTNYEVYGQFSLTDDPKGNVGFISNQTLSQGPAHIWLYNSILQVFPGFASPLTTYNPPDSQTQEIGTIAFDASGVGGAFQHVLVGTQRFAEGPGANWGYLQVANGTWTYTGNIDQVRGQEDMFADAVINSAGNWWVIARQFKDANSIATGWKIRAWDPPISSSSINKLVQASNDREESTNLSRIDGDLWESVFTFTSDDQVVLDRVKKSKK